MKAVAFVLTILFFVSIFNLLINPDGASGFGFGTMSFGSADLQYDDILYDESGHAVCYRNGTAVEGGEDGEMLNSLGWDGILTIKIDAIVGGSDCVAVWANTTNPLYDEDGWFLDFGDYSEFKEPYYALYDSPYGEPDATQSFVYHFFFGSQLGFLSVVAVVMAVVLLAGIKVFSTGLAETSVMAFVKGGVYMGLFLALSAFSYSLIISIPFVGVILYFGLTGIYLMGIMGSIIGSGAD